LRWLLPATALVALVIAIALVALVLAIALVVLVLAIALVALVLAIASVASARMGDVVAAGLVSGGASSQAGCEIQDGGSLVVLGC
jgi:hypothetical protein